MRKAAGFTLIELVIVIVILGILGAVAAPKFLNLQGDAYGANLNAVKSSMESAATLVNTKAILAGEDRGDDKGASTITIDIDGATKVVNLVNGYPEASKAGIILGLDIKIDPADKSEYVATEGAADSGLIYVSPKARNADIAADAAKQCRVIYKNAVIGKRPEITIENKGC